MQDIPDGLEAGLEDLGDGDRFLVSVVSEEFCWEVGSCSDTRRGRITPWEYSARACVFVWKNMITY